MDLTNLKVNLSADKETATAIGERHGSPFVYRVRSGQMQRDGFVFYQSKNGVWLTKLEKHGICFGKR